MISIVKKKKKNKKKSCYNTRRTFIKNKILRTKLKVLKEFSTFMAAFFTIIFQKLTELYQDMCLIMEKLSLPIFYINLKYIIKF